MDALTQFGGIIAATLISEDLTALTTGLLAANGRLPLWVGIAACASGIWAGDLGLWLAGHFLGRPARAWIGRPTSARWTDLASRVSRRPGRAILASRFLPGTRLPLYLASSSLGVPLRTFAGWSALAVLLWTPPLVMIATLFGEVAIRPLRAYLGAGWIVAPIAVMFVWQAGDVTRRVSTLVSRWRRWEFWPAWLFYGPVVVHVCRLLCRHGFGALTAANPGLEDGGFVGESKSAILEKLPVKWTLPAVRVAPGRPSARLDSLRHWMARERRAYPLILKPDVGQRGVGVRLVHSDAEATEYFYAQPAAAVAQVYHPGPYEAGIFYYRLPGTTRGRIFSITDKRFPVAVGDGVSTLEEIILGHARYRLQSRVFLERWRKRLSEVPPPGRAVPLGLAGNHAQGTLFLDGASLETEALVDRIDDIARRVDGFYIGRFDVRYRDPDRFMAGDDLAIVELNGVTSEATHIYDPSSSLLDAYRTLFRQWDLVFEIGVRNLARGCHASPVSRLLKLSFKHLTTWPALRIAD